MLYNITVGLTALRVINQGISCWDFDQTDAHESLAASKQISYNAHIRNGNCY